MLNPSSPRYARLKAAFDQTFRNELFDGDARQLLANSHDYFERTKVHHRNCEAITQYLVQRSREPDSSVVEVFHPSVNPSRANYERCLRRSTPDFEPGGGCLVSVELGSREQAKAFYDNLGVVHGPHMGAPRTLALPYNELVYGKDEVTREYHASYGLRCTQIRMAPGLEAAEDLVRIVGVAVDKANEAKRQGL